MDGLPTNRALHVIVEYREGGVGGSGWVRNVSIWASAGEQGSANAQCSSQCYAIFVNEENEWQLIVANGEGGGKW
jgi:hypothetical protein